MKLFTKILENQVIWRIFRKTIDILFGLYRKRIAVIRSFGITENTSIIDVACGTGQYSAITENKYLGVDISKKYTDTANRIYETDKKKFLCADANTAAIQDASYDAALLIDATHHLSNQENQKLLATLNRVASQSVIICDPIKQKPINLIGRFLCALDRGNYIRPKNDLLDLIGVILKIEKVVDMKMMGIESVCVLAKPRR